MKRVSLDDLGAAHDAYVAELDAVEAADARAAKEIAATVVLVDGVDVGYVQKGEGGWSNYCRTSGIGRRWFDSEQDAIWSVVRGHRGELERRQRVAAGVGAPRYGRRS